MELNEDQKYAIKALGDAINETVETSDAVNTVLEQLREMGYEANLNLKLEVALQKIETVEEVSAQEQEVEFTEDDLRTLKRMKIAVD